MKYIITESSLDKVILKYLDEIFPTDNIRTYVTIDFDDETGEDAPQRQNQTCPIVVVNHPYDDDLSDTFGENSWQEPFKKWIMNKFDLPVTTVDWTVI